MITIYDKDNKNSIDLEYYVNDVEKYFKIKEVKDNVLNHKNSESIMKAIDGVTERKDDYIRTPFGGCSVDKLSSGCKALLLANFYGNSMVINFVECGNNVIEYAVKHDMAISIFVPQTVVLSDYVDVLYNNIVIKWG